jgi:predicted enzyme related to lactoylglutathione lyase
MDCRLIAVRVFVRDWPRALAFYRDTLGLRVAFESAAMGWAQFDTGEAQLAIEVSRPDDEEDFAGRFVGVSLSVADIDATYEELRGRGVEFLRPPETMPWGGVLAHFRDPDGNVLTLIGSPKP